MTYMLGLDLGTTYTAAALWRAGAVEMVALGTHSHVIPSVVHLRADGTLITGEAAVRRSQSEPGRTAREFKRRLGDPTPILLGGTPLAAVDLMTALLRDVLAFVAERNGTQPSAVALTHPANWGQFKVDLLRQAADACDLSDVTLVTEPVAAAVDYAANARVPVGELVAVYDLGGGTFDAAVLRRTADGFETLGEPVGLERLGGIDFDHAVVAHVERTIAGTLATMDRDDPEVAGALTRLRNDCVDAKEGLSDDSEVVIPVGLPGAWSEVRLTRGEFEHMIAPALIEPLRAFRRGVSSAGVAAADIHTVLLVGGSSRVPLVAEMVAGELGRPVAVDTHPKHAVALGAARIVGGAQQLRPATTVGPVAVAAPTPAPESVAASAPAPAPAPTVLARDTPPAGRPRRRAKYVAAAVAAAAAASVGAFVVVGGSQGSSSSLGGTADDVAPSSVPATAPADVSSTVAPLPICGSPSGLCAFITDLRLDGDRYIANYTTSGFDPLVHGEDEGATEDDHHVHFFFDSTAPANAGANGQPPGAWELWGRLRGRGELVFDAFTVADAGDATQLCVAVATSGHEMLSEAASTGNCVALPA